jgi:hypothetical protein
MVKFVSVCVGATARSGPGPTQSRGFWITHNDASQSVGILWTSDQLVAEISDNTQHSQQTSMPQVGFEPATPAWERPQTYALDRAAAGTGFNCHLKQ